MVTGIRNGNLEINAEASHELLIAEKSRASQVVAGGRWPPLSSWILDFYGLSFWLFRTFFPRVSSII